MRCSNCDAEIDDDATICPFCGRGVHMPAATEGAQPTPDNRRDDEHDAALTVADKVVAGFSMLSLVIMVAYSTFLISSEASSGTFAGWNAYATLKNIVAAFDSSQAGVLLPPVFYYVALIVYLVLMVLGICYLFVAVYRMLTASKSRNSAGALAYVFVGLFALFSSMFILGCGGMPTSAAKLLSFAPVDAELLLGAIIPMILLVLSIVFLSVCEHRKGRSRGASKRQTAR